MHKHSTHFGVYGVCIRENKLLCIHKEAGPYRGRYDLPGGSQEEAEGLTDTLQREVAEETSYQVESYDNPRVYDSFVSHAPDVTVHHIFALYDIQLGKSLGALPKRLADGANDSSGMSWVNVADLSLANASPLVLKVVEELNGSSKQCEATVYPNWQMY